MRSLQAIGISYHSSVRFFQDVSLCISGEKYPTLSFSLQIYFLLINYVTKLEQDSVVLGLPTTRHGLQACKEKLIEYFDHAMYDSEYYYYPMVLDPRYKDTLFQVNSSLTEELFLEEWISDCANAFAKTCKELYDPDSEGQSEESQPQQAEPGNIHDFASAFKASVPPWSGQSLGSQSILREIAEYLSEDVILEDRSPLVWWRDNAP
ncbi:hypothetical protein FS749_002330 [Ceratobasidium sp. UAMH 11750]|nr:hypothetical protein FS749_002330 [Ceratobasidium sp. UAMH 11750]